jgi:hypothetical protein
VGWRDRGLFGDFMGRGAKVDGPCDQNVTGTSKSGALYDQVPVRMPAIDVARVVEKACKGSGYAP